jgi:hypothetical protein
MMWGIHLGDNRLVYNKTMYVLHAWKTDLGREILANDTTILFN